MTEDEADLKLLSLATAKGKFALDVLYVPSSLEEQLAIERGQEQEWFRLVDVSQVAAAPRRLFRVFILTPAGWARLRKLKGDPSH